MQDIWLRLREYIDSHTQELYLLTAALVIAALSLGVYLTSANASLAPRQQQETELPQTRPDSPLMYVEISGAVVKPDVYTFAPGTRLKAAIIKAGNLTKDADRAFFARNFNLARVLNDQDKVFIPTVTDVQSGLIKETAHLLDYSTSQILRKNSVPSVLQPEQHKVSINNGSIDDLDSLSGIGPSTAQKIISNRPYNALTDLLSKKVISQSLFKKIEPDLDL